MDKALSRFLWGAAGGALAYLLARGLGASDALALWAAVLAGLIGTSFRSPRSPRRK